MGTNLIAVLPPNFPGLPRRMMKGSSLPADSLVSQSIKQGGHGATPWIIIFQGTGLQIVTDFPSIQLISDRFHQKKMAPEQERRRTRRPLRCALPLFTAVFSHVRVLGHDDLHVAGVSLQDIAQPCNRLGLPLQDLTEKGTENVRER